MIAKFLFEDRYYAEDLSLTTPSSILLKSCLNGDNIYFSNGNELLETKLCEIYNKDDLFIVFIDVVPNNYALVTLYSNLVSNIEANDMDDNVIVLPIPCIEYYLIDMLSTLDMIFVKSKDIRVLYENLYLGINWGAIPLDKKSMSIEKLYKEVINLQRPYCLRNTNKGKSPYYGDFYKISCSDCNDKHCLNHKGYSREFKSEFLYTRLPIFDIVNECHRVVLNDLGISTKDCSIKEAKSKLQDFYNILCKDVNKAMITVL